MTNPFRAARACVLLFGGLSAVVLAVLGAVALTGGEVSTFMAVRAVLLLAAAALLHRLATQAARGVARSQDRLRAVSVVLPIAIIGLDLVPGLCPLWYAVLQSASALPLIAAAVLTRRRAVPVAGRE